MIDLIEELWNEHNFKDIRVIDETIHQYPETAREYWKICIEQYDLFCRKNSNYGPGNISVGTSLETEDDVKISLIGLFFRMNDKIQRLKQMVVLGSKDNVGEAIDDTYQDMSIYGIIAQMVKRGKWGK